MAEQRDRVTRELESLAAEARQILSTIRTRAKFDLSSVRGWRDLQEATVSERFAGVAPPQSLLTLRRRAVKWQALYRELRFMASTRPVWNT